MRRQEAEAEAERGGRRREERSSPGTGKTRPSDGRPGKLSYNERREWTELPGRIEALEHELHGLHERLSDPAFFAGDPDEIREVTQRAREIPDEIDAAFERWGELDARA